jgi:hypothetical protein
MNKEDKFLIHLSFLNECTNRKKIMIEFEE